MSLDLLWSKVSIGLPSDCASLPVQPKEVNWTAALVMLERSLNHKLRLTSVCDIDDFALPGPATDALHAVMAKAKGLNLEPFSRATHSTEIFEPYDGSFSTHVYDTMRPPRQTSWYSLRTALCNPAPNLQNFRLSTPVLYDYDTFPHLPIQDRLELHPDVFSGEVAKLRTCHLRGFTLPPIGCRAFSSLSFFEYEPRPPDISSSDLGDILSWMPQMETFSLIWERASFRPDIPAIARHACLAQVALRPVSLKHTMDLDDSQAEAMIDFSTLR